MRILLVFIFVATSICSSAQEDNFTIKGVITQGYAFKIHLRYKTDSETAIGIDVDKTAEVIEGKFSFSGYIKEPVQAYLAVDGMSSYGPVYLDTGIIQIAAKVDRVNRLTDTYSTTEITSVKGSLSDSLQRSFVRHRDQILSSDQNDSVNFVQLYAEVLAFVKKYPDHNLSSEILKDTYELSYPQAKLIFENLSPAQQEKAARNGVKATLDLIKVYDTLYPFIPLPDTTGKLIDSKESAYKYLLLDFWYSQCSYCHERHTALLPLYKKYHKAGFEVMSVSQDFDKATWINDITVHKLPWLHVSSLTPEENKIADHFKIPYMPFTVLIDRNGKTIAVNPDEKRLEKILVKRLPNP